MKERVGAFGSVIAAALASSCCWVPLLLAAVGAGGAGFASVLAPYRPYFMGVTLLMLAGAWYFALRKSPAVTSASPAGAGASGGACCVQEACCPRAQRRRSILLLIGVTALALAMLAFPRLSAALAGGRSPAPAAAARAGAIQTVTLRIEGMTCEACEGHIRAALLEVPGVVAAEVDYQTASARVTFQQGKVSIGQLQQAVAKTGYRVH